MSWSQSDAEIKSPSNAEKAIKSNRAPAPQHNLHVRAENEQGSAKPVCLKRVSRLLTLNFFDLGLFGIAATRLRLFLCVISLL